MFLRENSQVADGQLELGPALLSCFDLTGVLYIQRLL